MKEGAKLEFEYFSFTVSSSRLHIDSLYLDEDEDDWMNNNDPHEMYTSEIKISILGGACNDDGEEILSKPIGYIMGTLVNVRKANESGAELFYIFDSHSADAVVLYESISESDDLIDDYVGIDENVFLLDSIFIYEEYRHKGYGTKALHMINFIITYSLDIPIGCIAVIPKALLESKQKHMLFELANNPELDDLTKKFFINAGYRTIPGSEYMFINSDYKPSF